MSSNYRRVVIDISQDVEKIVKGVMEESGYRHVMVDVELADDLKLIITVRPDEQPENLH